METSVQSEGSLKNSEIQSDATDSQTELNQADDKINEVSADKSQADAVPEANNDGDRVVSGVTEVNKDPTEELQGSEEPSSNNPDQ